MKRSVAAAVLVFLIAGGSTLQAQQTGSQDLVEKRREQIEQLKSRLNLTPEQTDNLDPIVRQELDEMRAVRDRLGSDTSRHGRMTMLNELKEVQRKYQPQVNAILTPEQIDEWKKIKRERKQQLKDEYRKKQAAG